MINKRSACWMLALVLLALLWQQGTAAVASTQVLPRWVAGTVGCITPHSSVAAVVRHCAAAGWQHSSVGLPLSDSLEQLSYSSDRICRLRLRQTQQLERCVHWWSSRSAQHLQGCQLFCTCLCQWQLLFRTCLCHCQCQAGTACNWHSGSESSSRLCELQLRQHDNCCRLWLLSPAITSLQAPGSPLYTVPSNKFRQPA